MDGAGRSGSFSPFVAPHLVEGEDAAARQARLAKAVSKEIIPRLMDLHHEVLPPGVHPTEEEISDLAHLVLGPDNYAAIEFVRSLRARAFPMEVLFVELLEPAARHLGVMWENDECDFIDVTLGVARLQELLATFNATHELPALNVKRRVLLATTAGEQHLFGVAMVEKFLQAGGWAVDVALRASVADVVKRVRYNWYAVAGLTISCASQVDELKSLIAAIRSKSRNAAIGIMVGGPVFADDPRLVSQVGADATAINAPAAVLLAQKLFDIAVTGSQGQQQS